VRKTQNYLLKSDFKVKTLRKLSTPKYFSNLTEFSQTGIGSSFNLHKTHCSPQKESRQSSKINSNQQLNKQELMKKFHNFFEKCDTEEYHEKHQTDNAKEKIGCFQKEIKDLRKTLDSKKKDMESHEESNEGHFTQFKNQTKFKKKIIDILLSPIQNKHDLYFMYNKNQVLKDQIQKHILKEKMEI